MMRLVRFEKSVAAARVWAGLGVTASSGRVGGSGPMWGIIYGLNWWFRPTNSGNSRGIFLHENGIRQSGQETPQTVFGHAPDGFPDVFPVFLTKRVTVGLNGIRCRSGWDFPVPFSSLRSWSPPPPPMDLAGFMSNRDIDL